MATGITKLEQISPDSVSAIGMTGDFIPLPSQDASASLYYPNKASIEEIRHHLEKRAQCFASIEKSELRILDALPLDAFVLGDNIFVLHRLLQENTKATLFYLDPPYRTGFDFHSRGLEHAYKDTMGEAAYLEYIRRRLILIRECLADDGSIYVHIGNQMQSHMKVTLDEIFGAENFRNLIARRKCSSKNFTRNQYPNLNDYILFYSKGRKYKWTKPGIEPDKSWIEREYPRVDTLGRRYKLVPVHAPGKRNGETGQPWRGVLPPPGKHWQYAPSTLDQFDLEGDIHWSRNGNPRRKIYWSKGKKVPLTDYWDGYRDAHHQSIKITGYPTEKNLEMIKTIIRASTEPGDLVIDPYCGSGTTLHAARDLGRKYVGVDASFSAAKATLRRMRYGLKPMGDYVISKKTRARELPLEHLARFDDSCAFAVDKRLLDAHRTEIEHIAAV